MYKLPHLNLPARLTLLGAAMGVTLVGVLAAYFRRRRRPRAYKDILEICDVVDSARSAQALSNGPTASTHLRGTAKSPQMKTPNGDIANRARSTSPRLLQHSHRSLSNSTVSMSTDAASVCTVTPGLITDVDDDATPQQLCEMGLEAMQVAVARWENAVSSIQAADVSEDPVLEELAGELSHMLQRAYRLRDYCEQRLFRQVSTSAALAAALQEMDRDYEERKHAVSNSELSSDQDSFVSAVEVADLSDLEEQRDTHHHLFLYEAALLELTHGSIPCRTLRTRMLHCSSDTEFLAKLYCVRLAFQQLFSDETIRDWFVNCGRDLISSLLVKSDKDPEEFQVAFDVLLAYVKIPENWSQIETELHGRGVKMMTFYDIVIDFILLDAFDDLENPPSSVTTVVQNRWLSNGFKETALSTAVWSVLKAKRRLLKFSDGFIAHFYAISEHVSPVLAWGFLGPDGPLRQLCYVFKDQILAFMCDVFSFGKVRYTTVEQLTDDVLQVTRKHMNNLSEKLNS